MKKFYYLLTLAASAVSAQTLTFADPQFKAYLLTSTVSNNIAVNGAFNSIKIDTNGDGQIQASEASQVVKLWVNDPGVTSIAGVEGFANLTELNLNDIGATTVAMVPMPGLQKLQFANCAALTSVDVSGMAGLVQINCSNDLVMASLNLSGCSSLTDAVLMDNALATLDVSNHANLANLYLDRNPITSLNVSGCTNLTGITCRETPITAIDVSGLTSLYALDVTGDVQLQSINASGCTSLYQPSDLNNLPALTNVNFSGCSSLTILSATDEQLASVNLSGCTSLTNVNVSGNQLAALDISGCAALIDLQCHHNQLATLDVSGCTALVNLGAHVNLLQAIDLSALNNLTTAALDGNLLTSFTLTSHPALNTLWLHDNTALTDLDLSGCSGLSMLGVPENLVHANLSGCSALPTLQVWATALTSIDVSGCSGLTSLSLDVPSGTGPLTSLDVSGLSNLNQLFCSNLSLNSLNLAGCGALVTLFCDYNPLTALDLSGCHLLQTLSADHIDVPFLDVSSSSAMANVYIRQDPQLTQIFAKNGASENIYTGTDPQLTFICQDEPAVEATLAQLQMDGMSSVTCNSYCSFNPGGNYNTITGNVTFDTDGNGCDASDPLRPDVRIDITDGATVGATFSQTDGHYVFYTGEGTFTLAPAIENPGFFFVTPASPAVSFPDTANGAATRDFCIAANGVHHDLEIVLAPIHGARPGFDAVYQLIIRNKGNQVESGSYTMAYDGAYIQYLSATVVPDAQNPGSLSWNFSNLIPFEVRTVYIVMHVNSPTDSPAVNIGDILGFQAGIAGPGTDETPADNNFILDQAAIGSWDPNEITCLEGASLPTSEIGNYLHYIANFENTGTAEAENVVVRIDVDPTQYDIASLQLLAASHPAYTRISGNRVEFIFEGIDLGVAADPPVGGHGNVLFKIRSNNALVQDDHVVKRASIFFDYNAPVETLPADTVYSMLRNPGAGQDPSVSIFPNPVSDRVQIQAKSNLEGLELFDGQGRILERRSPLSPEFTLDVSARAGGVYFLRIRTSEGEKVVKMVKS